jgi:hypothetical protein
MGPLQLMGHIGSTEGVGALYKGIVVELSRGVLSAALMLMVKEQLDSVVERALLALAGR